MKSIDLRRNELRIRNKKGGTTAVILFTIALIVFVITITWITREGYKWFVTIRWPEWTGFGNKTLWDLMQLLIVPAILAIGAYFFAALHAQTERKAASNNIQETALQTYLDKMTELLLKENLRESKENSEVRAVARARTLTMIRGLDGDRKGALLRFLYEANLIYKNKKVIDLSEADLTLVNLGGVKLREVNLRGADLSKANLVLADLSNADLSGARLIKANLRGADLISADLQWANLREADLTLVNLDDAKLSEANLSTAILLEADLNRTDLSRAKYSKNSEDWSGASIMDTIWPHGFDPEKAGAIRVDK